MKQAQLISYLLNRGDPSILPHYPEVNVNDPIEVKRHFPEILRRHADDGFVIIGDCYDMYLAGDCEDYSTYLGIDVNRIVYDKVRSARQVLRVGDVGCGNPKMLKELKEEYGKDIEVVGFDLISLSHHDSLDLFVEGDFEKSLDPGLVNTFDLIFSCNTFRYLATRFSDAYSNVKRLFRTNDSLGFVNYSNYRGATRTDELSAITSFVARNQSLVVNSSGCMRIRSDSPDNPLEYLKKHGAFDL
ncbi:class I SAM-dependent methyltransferase [Candidatus Woesearchaeota archaeon]|nr:class I SAM-dependent methyltransferase [Candidatus Woesearchaeota archaeon]